MKRGFGIKKKVLIALGILLAVILLIPIPRYYKDGGTVEYRAVLYSVKLVHSLTPPDSDREYYEGTVVTVLGVEVFDSVEWDSYEERSD